MQATELNTAKLIESSQAASFGSLPSQFEVSKDELTVMMKEYTKLLEVRKSLEEMIPRAFNEEKDLSRLSDNLEYTKKR